MYNPFSEIKFLRWQVEELSKRVLELELGEKADKDACKTVHVATGACAGCKHYVAWTQRIGVKAYDHYACRLNKQCADRDEQSPWVEITRHKDIGERFETVEATPFDWNNPVTYTADKDGGC